MGRLQLRRVYDAPDSTDGLRILVDRLWPRGVRKDDGRVGLWLKDIAPSQALRVKFHAQPALWDEFCRAYAQELASQTAAAAVAAMRAHLARGDVTLLYAARDEQRNNAVALRDWLLHD